MAPPVKPLLNKPAYWRDAFAAGYLSTTYDAKGKLPARTQALMEKIRPKLGKGGEIDFIWRRGKRAVGIEVKASNRYRSEEAATLREFLQRKLLGSAYVVYDGRDVLQDGGITVLPVAEFMRRLARGESSCGLRSRSSSCR